MRLGCSLEGKSRSEHVEAAQGDYYEICWMFNDDYIGDMRPREKPVLRYRNMQMVDSNNASEFQHFVDNGLLLKDYQGNYITHRTATQNYLIDINNVKYHDFVNDWIIDRLNLGYDGIFGDLLGYPFVRPVWDLSARPIDPRTGSEMLDVDQAEYMIGLIGEVRGTHMLVGNAITQASGPYGYYTHKDSYDRILPLLDYAMVEGAFGWNVNEPRRSEQAWRMNVQMIEEVDDLWVFNHFTYGDALFVYASYLCGANDENIYMYGNKRAMDSEPWRSYMAVEPGSVESPLLDASAGWFVREYSGLSAAVDAVNKRGSYTLKGVQPPLPPPPVPPPVPVPPAADPSDILELLKGFVIMGTFTLGLKELLEDDED